MSCTQVALIQDIGEEVFDEESGFPSNTPSVCCAFCLIWLQCARLARLSVY